MNTFLKLHLRILSRIEMDRKGELALGVYK